MLYVIGIADITCSLLYQSFVQGKCFKVYMEWLGWVHGIVYYSSFTNLESPTEWRLT